MEHHQCDNGSHFTADETQQYVSSRILYATLIYLLLLGGEEYMKELLEV